MKVLVTGGLGYIGSHTAVELINKGFDVLIADSLFNSELFILDNIQQITGVRPFFEKIDLSDLTATQNLFKKYDDIIAVVNFAAYKAVGESVQKPLMYYHNNLGILMNILDCMQTNKIARFVQSSSCTVYGNPDRLPVKESSPIKPAASPYGNTKQISEEILYDISLNQRLKTICLRYFNPIGSHESHLIGELPKGVPNNLLPFITQTAIGKREILSVFGNDYHTPDGTCIRDYIHVTDLAKSHVSAIERLLNQENKSSFEVFNIGTGKGFSVLEVIKSFEKTSGQRLKYQIVGRRVGDVEQIWADATLSYSELNWKAEKTLDEMTLSAWEWEKYLKNIKNL